MMKRLGNITLGIAILALLSLTINIVAYAAYPLAVVGTHIKNDHAELLVAGDLPGSVSARISGIDSVVEATSLSQAYIDTRTLFLIDVSTSMRQSSRAQVMSLLEYMVEHKNPDEQFAIDVFGEQYRDIIDFTADRFDLVRSLERVVWEDQASSIYHAMATAVQQSLQGQADGLAFSQIVVFTDGMDNADDSITRQELFLLLSDSSIPVHTVGFLYENNAGDINELHAFSRITGAVSYTLSAGDGIAGIVEALASFNASVHYLRVELPEQLRDGAVRPLELLNDAGIVLLTYDLRMPLAAGPQPEREPEATPEQVPTTTPELPEEPQNWMPIIVIIAAIIVLAGMAAVIVKRRKTRQSNGKDIVLSIDQTQFLADEDATMLLIEESPKQLGIGGSGFYLTLSDLGQPHKRFEMMIESKIEIGREPGQPGITIDYDRKISRKHCSVSLRSDAMWIEDLGSSNKTYLNDEAVKAPRMLRDGDIISCGNTKFSVGIERR